MRTLVLLSLIALAAAPAFLAAPATACHPEGPEPDPNHHGCGGNMDPHECLTNVKTLVRCVHLP